MKTFTPCETAASIFFLLGGSLRLALYAHKVSQNVQGSLIMQAYTSSEAAAGAVRDALAGSSDIEEIRLISPQEALEVLRAKLKAFDFGVFVRGQDDDGDAL